MSDLLKRKGIFKVTRLLVESNPDEVIESLKDVLIVDVDNDFMTNTLIYKGYSKYFDIIEFNETIPTYVAQISNNSDGIKVTWHREKEYSEKSVMSMLEEINRGIREADERIINRATEVTKKLQGDKRRELLVDKNPFGVVTQNHP